MNRHNSDRLIKKKQHRENQARVAKLCMQVEYIKCQSWDDRLTPSGRGQGHVTRL